jgi:thiol-disulfide isomerase/thioredoxin
VAIASVVLALTNYLWTFTHPITPVQLLVSMQSQSAPLNLVGRNDKPTVVDFWAPWCENCRFEAPTLLQVEQEYKDKVNFVMVNGDDADAWPLIEAFGVDAIPHMALVDAKGNVQTALIGQIPKHVLEADLDMLVKEAGKKRSSSDSILLNLPYTMLDVFEKRPEARHVQFGELD